MKIIYSAIIGFSCILCFIRNGNSISDENYRRMAQFNFIDKFQVCNDQLKQYQKFLLNQILSDDHSCAIYDYVINGDGSGGFNSAPEYENSLDENQRMDSLQKSQNAHPKETNVRTSSLKSRDKDIEIVAIYEKLRSVLTDPLLDQMILEHLYRTCTNNDQSALKKRTPQPITISPSYFNPWGGKRSMFPANILKSSRFHRLFDTI